MALHFWTLEACAGVDSWDPDLQPQQHQSGYGHGFLELYARLRTNDYPVSIGRLIPVGTDVVIVSLEELDAWKMSGRPDRILSLCKHLFARRLGLAVIRTDLHLYRRAPLSTTLEIMPSKASIERKRTQLALPLLPQRAIVRRDPSREAVIRTVGLKAFAHNVPEWLAHVDDELALLGVDLRVDTEDGVGASWADYRDVDAALCIPGELSLDDDRRKPPTKLVNAWVGGVIPVCYSLPAYVELAAAGQDSLFVASPEDIVSAIRQLNEDPSEVRRMLANSQERGNDFALGAMLRQWYAVLSTARRVRTYRIILDALCATLLLRWGLNVKGLVYRIVDRLDTFMDSLPR